MFQKIIKKINIHNFPLFCFYISIVSIIALCLLEAITYPGIFFNKIGIKLSHLILFLDLIFLASYIKIFLSKQKINYLKKIIIVSVFTVIITLFFSLLESSNYSNFVFSKFHINYRALQTLSSALSSFILIFLISKINFKQILNNKSKIFLIGLFALAPLLSYFSWSQHLSKNNLVQSESRLSKSAKYSLIFIDDPAKKNALKDQITWFFKTTNQYSKIKIFFNLITISFFTLFFIIAILFFLNWLQNKKSKRLGLNLILFYFGGIIYSIILILISVTMFSIGELKAFQGRYILSYGMALIMFSIFIFIKNFSRQKNNKINFLYLIILFLIINIFNFNKLKPADEKIFIERQNQDITYQKIKNIFPKNSRPILHTIGEDGAVNYRYSLAPIQVISPIWQDWDIFMFTNPSFKDANYVFLTKASMVTQKWSNIEVRQVFRDQKFIKDNGVYKIVHTDLKGGPDFYLELINNQ